MSSTIESLPRHALRKLIASVVLKLEIDLETRAIVLELGLPAWAMNVSGSVEARLGLDGNFLRTTVAEAQRQNQPKIAILDCLMISRACYDCHRRAA